MRLKISQSRIKLYFISMENPRQIINSFLSEQKKLYRIVFVQKYWYLMEIKEIAELNEISESKTASILYIMRNKLKKRLEKEGYRL